MTFVYRLAAASSLWVIVRKGNDATLRFLEIGWFPLCHEVEFHHARTRNPNGDMPIVTVLKCSPPQFLHRSGDEKNVNIAISYSMILHLQYL